MRVLLPLRVDELPANSYPLLKQPSRYQIKTSPREKPARFRTEIVRAQGYENIYLLQEMVAFLSPTAVRETMAPC